MGIVLASVLLSSPADAFRNLKEGAEAPDFTLKGLKGEDVTLSSFKGKAVVIAFVHQGQEKSEKVLKALAALDAAVAAKTQVLAVLVDSGEGNPAGWAPAAGAAFPVLLDPAKDVYGKYGVFVTPATGVVKPDGTFEAEVASYSASYKDETEGLLKLALGLATEEELKTAAEKAKVPETSKERKMAERELEKARKLVERRMKDKAVEAAKQAVKSDPAYGPAHAFLGRLLLDVSDKNADEAMGHFQKALELDAKDLTAVCGAARVKALQGDTDGAVAMLEEAAKGHDHPERALFELGVVQEKAGRHDKAVKAYRGALELVLEE